MIFKTYNLLSVGKISLGGVKLYQLLKHTAKIHAVQRKLESVHDENLYMAHKFRQNRDFRFLSLRTQRTIESLTNSVIEEMVVDRLQEMNITYEVFSKMNSTDLKTFLTSDYQKLILPI